MQDWTSSNNYYEDVIIKYPDGALMHPSSIDNLRFALQKHVLPDPALGSRAGLKVLEVGSADFNGGYRQVLDLLECHYTGVDLEPGAGVDIVLDDPYVLPFSDSSFDIVVTGNTFEHADFFWKTFAELCRVVSPIGVVILLVPSAGPVHRYPTDSYRFQPDAMAALAKHAGVTLVESWTNPYGPWYDAVGVFRKEISDPRLLSMAPDLSLRLATKVQNSFPPDVPDEVEHGAGTEDCYDFLVRMHQQLQPDFYVEIGVEYGASLRLAACPALGIDPAPQLKKPLANNHRVSLTTSDDFFHLTDAASQLAPIDLAYIDGMHQIEFALKDFMNIEKYSHAGSVIIVDDIYPAHPVQGARIRESRFWTGDVWKLIDILEYARPDLILLPIDTSPTGSLMILCADSNNPSLWSGYDYTVKKAIATTTEPPKSIVERIGKIDPQDPLLEHIFSILLEARRKQDYTGLREYLRHFISGALPRTVVK